jgi:hypothetical protein
MSTANLCYVYNHCNDFFLGTANHEQWHCSQWVPVPKSGDLLDPNKWRGVMLIDVCSKTFSSVMNGRAFRLLNEHGTRFRFGGTPELGCRDGLFVLKTLLTMRKNHNLPSYVAFVDLIKAYDTSNHKLLLTLLEKYGAPPCFVSAVEKMHQNLVVVLKIEKDVKELWQSVGVRQGDNMAPVLFLFLMSAFAETLKIKWKSASISVCRVRSVIGTELANGREKLRGHLPKDYLSRSLTAVEILQCLYVDDRAFIFMTCANLTKELDLIYKHFARFGLEMHIRREGSPSKTECIFFPPSEFFNSHLPTLQQGGVDFDNTLEDKHDDIITADDRHNEQKAWTRQDQEGVQYNELKETHPIYVDDGSVTFCHHFKYLPYGAGDKEQLMCQNATAKFVGSDILRKVQKTISFCTKLT